MPGHFKLVELSKDVGLDDCYIFNTYRYFELHKIPNASYIALLNTDTNAIIGVCHFTELENKVFISPFRGTFAGPELLEDNFEALQAFLALLEEALKQRGARQIAFTAAPFQYNTLFSEQLERAATGAGYAITKNDPSYIIEVNDAEFAEGINRNHHRNLKKCTSAGFIFKQVFTNHEMRQVYDVIAANRRRKGYDISMTWEQIMQMQSLFADGIYFFGALHNKTIIAAAICIRINADALYVFYWGDIPGYEHYSPVTFVAEGIYKFARQNHFKWLDAGSASLNGQPIGGLIHFKEGLGFVASRKLTYAKTL